jgi:hypothetical protein
MAGKPALAHRALTSSKRWITPLLRGWYKFGLIAVIVSGGRTAGSDPNTANVGQLLQRPALVADATSAIRRVTPLVVVWWG